MQNTSQKPRYKSWLACSILEPLLIEIDSSILIDTLYFYLYALIVWEAQNPWQMR